MTHVLIPHPAAEQIGSPPVRRRPGRPRRLVSTVLSVIALAAAVLVLGPLGLLPFGLLLALSAGSDPSDTGRTVTATPRNLGLGTAVVVAAAGFWWWHLDLAESTAVVIAAALIASPLALQQSAGDAAHLPTTTVTRRSLVLSVLGLVTFTYLYPDSGYWPYALAGVSVVLPLALAVSRTRSARQRVELGLLRHPFHPTVRPHLLQGLNIWLCAALVGGVIAAGGTHYMRIGYAFDAAQFGLVLAALATGLVLLAALALVPSRRVHAPTNVVVALLSGFLALQLVQTSTSPAAAVVLDAPLTGEWFVLNAGRGAVINGHSPNEGNAVDFVRLGANGRTHTGGSDAPLAAYPGFGQPVMAPTDGRIVEVADGYPDNPPGTNSDYANHLVMDIGDGRYLSMAHLQHGSVTVRVGDDVRTGQPLAAVGNNGHSSEPHLHLQVQDSPAGVQAEHTYPVVFRDVTITRAGAWPLGDSRGLRTGDLVRAHGE